jgi:hypothetical protein
MLEHLAPAFSTPCRSLRVLATGSGRHERASQGGETNEGPPLEVYDRFIMTDVVQRPSWSGTAIKGGDLFTLMKRKAGVSHTAVCELWSHQLGWELRLLVSGELQRSQVCRTADEWLEVRDLWRTAMLDKGWSAEVTAPDDPVPGERPKPASVPPIDDAPVQPMTAPDDTKGG